jgi:PAS domain S-box-containing protein
MGWSDLTGEALFAALPAPALIFAADGTVVAANQGAAELFERDLPFPALTVTELLAQPERTRLDPLTWMRKWADSPDAPELDYVYLTCRTARGREKQLSVRVARLDGEGAGEANYLVTMHDVSSWEKRLHDEREAHRVAARVLAISADAVIIVDENFDVTYANNSAYRLLGYPNGALLHMPLAGLIPERFRGRHDAFMARFAKETNPARLMGERSPVVALTRDGREIPVEASIARLTIRGKPVFSAQLRARAQDRAGTDAAHA